MKLRSRLLVLAALTMPASLVALSPPRVFAESAPTAEPVATTSAAAASTVPAPASPTPVAIPAPPAEALASRSDAEPTSAKSEPTVKGKVDALTSDSPVTTPPEHIRLAMEPLTWDREPGVGLSLGMEIGLWGTRQATGARIGYGFLRNFAVHLRGIMVIETEGPDPARPYGDAGARLDVIGRSQPILNVVRLYGGGVQVFSPAFNIGDRRKVPIVRGGGARIVILARLTFFPWTEYGRRSATRLSSRAASTAGSSWTELAPVDREGGWVIELP